MPRKSRENVIREVNDRVDAVVRDNRRLERLVDVLVLILLPGGLLLTAAAAVQGRWYAAAALCGVVLAAVVRLVRIRVALQYENNRLQLLPELLRLAEEADAKRLATEHVEHMLERMRRS